MNMNSRIDRLLHPTHHEAPPPTQVQPWAKAASWLAFLSTLPSAAWRVAMVAGADVGYAEAHLYRGSGANAGDAAYLLALEVLQIGAGVLCLGLCQKWGERAPRWVPILGGRGINPKLPLMAGALGNALLYIIIYSTAALFPVALLQQPPAWTPVQGMSTTQTTVVALCYSPMLLWPIALTVALTGFRRRHWPRHG